MYKEPHSVILFCLGMFAAEIQSNTDLSTYFNIANKI